MLLRASTTVSYTHLDVYKRQLQNGGTANLALVQTGTGALTLSGASTYLGNTTVSNGTLNITGSITGNSTTSTLVYGGSATNTIVNVSGDMTPVSYTHLTTTLSTTSVNFTGTITNSGLATGSTTISAVIGTNLTGIIQNSTTSSLTLGAVANLWNTGLTIKAGTVIGGNNANTFGDNANILTIGDSSGALNASLQVTNSLTYLQPITCLLYTSRCV